MDDCGPECEETLREIERFLDDELEVSVRAEIDRHIADCHPCTERLEFRRHLKFLIASKCVEDRVPPELRRRVEDLIRGAGSTEPSGRPAP
jgi:mycothiol system anti-sigma-R factor